MTLSKPAAKDAVENILENFQDRNIRHEHLLLRTVMNIDAIDINQPRPNAEYVNKKIKDNLTVFTRENKVACKKWINIHSINTTLETDLIQIADNLFISNHLKDAKFMALELKLRLAVNLADALAVHMGDWTINGIPFSESLVRRIMEAAESKGAVTQMVFEESDLG